MSWSPSTNEHNGMIQGFEGQLTCCHHCSNFSSASWCSLQAHNKLQAYWRFKGKLAEFQKLLEEWKQKQKEHRPQCRPRVKLSHSAQSGDSQEYPNVLAARPRQSMAVCSCLDWRTGDWWIDHTAAWACMVPWRAYRFHTRPPLPPQEEAWMMILFCWGWQGL